MTSLDISIADAFQEYQVLIRNYPVFLSILLAMVILGVLLTINKEKTVFYCTLSIFALFVIMTVYTRKGELITQLSTIFNRNFYQNLYFYYWNMSLIFLLFPFLLATKKISKVKKGISILVYILLTTNAIFQYYISSIVNHQALLVLGNTYPMIMIGNLLVLIFYLYLIIDYFVFYKRRRAKKV